MSGARAGPVQLSQATLVVEEFRFNGQTVFSQQELQDVLADALGRALTLSDLEAAVQKITRFYRSRGYPLATAVLPEQRIEDGRVDVTVFEGRYGEVRWSDDDPLRAGVLPRLLRVAAPGKVIEQTSLVGGLRWLAEVLGVARVRGELRRGEEPGTADLILTPLDEQQTQGWVELDNFGTDLTGEWRVGSGVRHHNLFGFGDRVTVQGLTTGPDLRHFSGAYWWPLTDLIGAELRYANTEVALGGEFAILEAGGAAEAIGISLDYAEKRAADGNRTWRLTYETRRLQDEIALFALETEKRANLLSLDVLTEHSYGTAGAAARLLAGIGLTGGHLDILTPSARELDAATARTQGAYLKVRGNASILQQLDERSELFGRLSGQVANKNLDSSEKLPMTGPDAVRAYQRGAISGDHGVLLTLEPRYRLLSADTGFGSLQALAFVDLGLVWRNQDPFGDSSEANMDPLYGAGLGVLWTSPFGLRLQGHYARRLGPDRAIPTSPSGGQFWLQAVLPF